MIFDGRIYSVLIVSSSDKITDALRSLMPSGSYEPVVVANSISAAKRNLLEASYDFVIINTPLPDDFGMRFAIDVCADKSTVCLMLVRSEHYEETHAKVSPHGVFTLSKPSPASTIQIALSWMATTRERLRNVAKKSLSLEEKMEEIRLVNRAKWILINQLKMTEPEAHRYIEKQAMDCCVTKYEIAQSIIRTYT